MSHERESERGGAFTRRNVLDGAAYTAALSLPLESPAAEAGRPPVSAAPGCVMVTLRINDQAAEHRLTRVAAGRNSRSRRPDGNEKGLRPWPSVEHAPCTWTVAAFSRA